MVYRISSCFGEELKLWRNIKLAAGVKNVSIERHINYFDDFIRKQNITEIKFTKEDWQEWIKFRPEESEATRQGRIVYSYQILIFLKGKGYDIYSPHRLPHVNSKIQYYIYSDEERNKYFAYIDTVDFRNDPMCALCYPVIFRILYSCGTRVEETLAVKVKDVDLDAGIIRLTKTKNNKERYVPISNSLKEVLNQYASKCLYLKNEDDYFFAHIDRRPINAQSIYWLHRKALQAADIPYRGGGLGPRVHDWRHTMAVRCLEQFMNQGADLYNVLPILSKYLGHTNISATERYLHLVEQNFKNVNEKTIETIKTIAGDNYDDKDK